MKEMTEAAEDNRENGFRRFFGFASCVLFGCQMQWFQLQASYFNNRCTVSHNNNDSNNSTTTTTTTTILLLIIIILINGQFVSSDVECFEKFQFPLKRIVVFPGYFVDP